MIKAIVDNLPPRVLSGVQPSGELHLGNYFGAIKQLIDLQHEYPGEAFYFIADYHALTTIQDAAILQRQSWNVVLGYLALGLDPNKATIYRQSDVPQVCELMWILSCVGGKGLLDRAPAYKDKLAKGQRPTLGLYCYPALMTADILAVRATVVPVGKDQEHHLEITRAIAKSFNAAYETTLFPLPETRVSRSPTLPGIDGQKMSKSYENTIPIFADEEDLEAKIMHVKTSSTPLGSPLNPDDDTLFALYRPLLTPELEADLRRLYNSGDIGYAQVKTKLVKCLKEYFEPFKARREALSQDTDTLEDILREGARCAQSEADETLEMARELVGLGRYHRAAILHT